MGRPTHLTDADVEQLGAELDAIRENVMNDLGEADARYIYRVMNAQRFSEIAGRALLFAGFLPPAWLAGVALLSTSKILENMEIGHNAMHGQWDWMHDPALDSATYDWDNTCPGDQWKHSHNYMHHTYTNIVGMDRDVGYSIMRMSADQKWYPQHLFQPLYVLALASLFQWGVALHDLEWERIGKDKTWGEAAAQGRMIWKKVRKQMLKDYLLFPLMAGPAAPFVLTGNLAANFNRNVWSFLIIFCGHFTEEAEMFRVEETENETSGEWYLRQMLASSNVTGSVPFHVMTGHLGYQIEHHLFPDMPSNRYREIGPRIEAVCKRYKLNYNTGSFTGQLSGVAKRILKLALPTRRPRTPTASSIHHEPPRRRANTQSEEVRIH